MANVLNASVVDGTLTAAIIHFATALGQRRLGSGLRRRRSQPPLLDVVRVSRVGLGRHVLAHARAVAAAVGGANSDADALTDVRTCLRAYISAERGAECHADGLANDVALFGADTCANLSTYAGT